MTLNPLELEYPVVVGPDTCTDGTFCYAAEHPDLPGCVAHGDSISEAKALLSHARLAYLNHLIARGLPIPMPSPFRPREWQAGIVERASPVIEAKEYNVTAA